MIKIFKKFTLIIITLLLVVSCANSNLEAIELATSQRNQGNYYEALNTLQLKTNERVEKIEEFGLLFDELVSLQGAKIFKYFSNVSTISDLEFIYPQLMQFLNIIDDRQKYLYVSDLIDLIWLNKNYGIAEIFLENYLKKNFIEIYNEYSVVNNSFTDNSFKSSSEIAKYLSNKSITIKSYSGVSLLGTGSGFFINSRGLALTNYHVIDGASRIVVILNNGQEFNAKLVAQDEFRDVAILSVPTSGNEFVKLGNSYLVETGDKIYTYGNPLGLTNTISDGLVSKNISIVNGKEYIQLSAPISPGSSGGMLVDERGVVIGITTAGLIRGQNLNLAIPINRVINLIKTIDQSINIEDYRPYYYVDITKETINKIEFYRYIKNDSEEKFLFLDSSKVSIYGKIESNSSYYEGELNSNIRSGQGVLIQDEYIYAGQFVLGAEQGNGIKVYQNGDVFKGSFKNGRPDGYGSYYWGSENSKLFGHFYLGTLTPSVDSSITGTGTYFYPSGDVYIGEFINGLENGVGEYHWHDGDSYYGDFKKGFRTGKGEYYWADGDYYIGDFINGERTGKGEYYWTDGDYYIGSFINGERTGKGEFYWADGDYYIGDFLNGYRTGLGRFVFDDGDYYIGAFLNSEFSGYGEYYATNNTNYKGNFLQGKPNGNGVRRYSNGDTFTANWTDWCNASGTYRWANGRSELSRLVNCEWK
jgi:S1-C subfamily serine protease